MKTIKNNNLLRCNMKWCADLKSFTNTQQGKLLKGIIQSEVLNISTKNSTLRDRTITRTDWIQQCIDIYYKL